MRLGVDVGGTFTDLLVIDEEAGEVHVEKVPTTTGDPAAGVLDGATRLLERAGLDPAGLDQFLHGTTIATNIVLERDGARTGMITTEGFRDILHTARHRRPLTFSIHQEVPWQEHPLVPRENRLPVAERIVPPTGEVEIPLDEDAVRAAARLLAARGVEAVAVCLLFSFLNPVHEQRVGEILREELADDVYVFLRSDVAPRYREYEAFSTAALCAYVGPKTNRYLERLSAGLAGRGIRAELQMMTSAGGVATVAGATRQPANLLMSGPVGGLMGGLWAARLAGFDNVITLDVGGTSADIGVAPRGELRLKHLLDTQVGGYAAMIPMAELDTIGAGGGSLAYVDETGMFHVGPQSAGAHPGPACYMRGGTRPTVTDAMVVLGRLRPSTFLGGAMVVDPALAEQALREHVCGPLGMDVEEAAASTVGVITHSMIQAIELNSVQKGYDPRDFTFVALGGAGAQFACEIGQEMGIPRVLIPPRPGITSALGLLATDTLYEFSATEMQPLAELDWDRLVAHYTELDASALQALRRDAISEEDIALRRYADCRYANQGYELTVEIPALEGDPAAWAAAVEEAFHAEHERTYSRRFDGAITAVNIRVMGVGRRPEVRWPLLEQGDGDPSRAVVHEQDVVYVVAGERRRHPTKFYDRALLRAGDRITGAAVVEQFDSTTVINPGIPCTVDPHGNLILETA
ncbi:hydantoinase/oxoprolinase family protein [Baekduia soli]|uniref:Hydantoinase/oxoprolinase family protein n=1 Tax=Baekduia soli TaxID=496014 RepID=A0A5B8U131_9ACTN|nr:hydantoinase/oxoprolinase family protein [Baekduia soli]QEC46535.1 hydantoinase/oxoprolinase family protein [Baekduia soli]